MNLVLNYLEKNYTHFINTHSLSSQSHLIDVRYFGVMLVGVIAMASFIGVKDAIFILMFHVV